MDFPFAICAEGIDFSPKCGNPHILAHCLSIKTENVTKLENKKIKKKIAINF